MTAPTPLDQSPVLARAVGLTFLGVKREDRTSALYGGNKVRGLEFLLAGARPRTAFVTVGGTGSTHCLATALHASALGHSVVLARFPQPFSTLAEEVAAAAARAATQVVTTRARALLPFTLLDAWRRAGRLGPRRWIPAGGATPRAVLGHVLAGLELADQVDTAPDAIVVPLGSGGTAAGLLLAIGLMGWPTRLVAARVAPVLVANRPRVLRLARRARALLSGAGIAAPVRAGGFATIDAAGKGYGWPSAPGEEARRLAAESGLVLDSTYGGKAFAVVPQLARAGFQRLLFWHTFATPPSSAPEPPA